MRKILIVALLFGALSCGDDEPSRPSGPPTFQRVTLVPNAPLVDTVLVSVESDRADSVVFWVDGERLAGDDQPPFQFSWDSRSVSEGLHTFALRAVGEAGYTDTLFSRVVDNFGDLRVAITSAPTLVRLGRSYALAANILDGPPSSLTWAVVEGAAHGIIQADGVYHAPETLPNPPMVTFRAIALGDPAGVAEATADIAEPVVVTISDYPEFIFINQTAQLTALVEKTSDTRLRWSLDEGPAYGTIDQNGLYQAPPVAPDPPQVTFRATSLVDSVESGAAVGYIIGTVTLTIEPDSTWLYPGGVFHFQAALEGAPPEYVRWEILGGAEFGTVDAAGAYTAPAEIPSPPHALVRSWCELAPEAADTAVVEIRPVPPPPLDVEPFREMYESGFVATALAEQVTGIAATALQMARYLGGNDQIKSGYLHQEAGGWQYEHREGNILEISPLGGATTTITYAVADGRTMSMSDALSYTTGMEFKGELDCTIRVGDPGTELRLTNSSLSFWDLAKPNDFCTIEGMFERTLKGGIPGADGGVWEVDLALSGEMFQCLTTHPYWRSEVGQSLAGTFTTPSGLAVAVQDTFFTGADGDFYLTTARRYHREGSFTVEQNGNTYAWTDLSVLWSWDESGPRDADDWRATGSLLKNGVPFGAIGFDLPTPPTAAPYPNPQVDFGEGDLLILDWYEGPFYEADWPAWSPFR